MPALKFSNSSFTYLRMFRKHAPLLSIHTDVINRRILAVRRQRTSKRKFHSVDTEIADGPARTTHHLALWFAVRCFNDEASWLPSSNGVHGFVLSTRARGRKH